MVSRKSSRRTARGVLAAERGTIRREAGAIFALGYPAPYRVGASSLGAQTVYRRLNQVPGLACTRFFLPTKGPAPRPLVGLETRRPVSGASAIGFSVACETDLAGVVELLEAADLAPLAAERDPADPAVIVGGPLTVVDARLVASLADAVVVGEGEAALPILGETLAALDGKEALLEALDAAGAGLWVPARSPSPPSPAVAGGEALPASAATWSPDAELRDLFLVEAARGCKRGCTFCVLSARSGCPGGFRPVAVERVLEAIPEDAPGVGLVGAAVTDHPRIVDLVREIVASGRRVSLSSVRADRVTPELAELLRRGGSRSLTLAADGASERLRRSIHKGITAADLEGAADHAAGAGIRGLKVYAMIGLPGEEDADVLELAGLVESLGRRLRVSLAVQAFVPKPGTPLAAEEMAGEALLRHRLDLLGRKLKGRARILPTSPRWSWVDWRLAHAGERAASIAVAAHREGGGFAAWRRAIEAAGLAGRV